jgi:hypothetical protein
MPSPFPGMDPYLEDPLYWGGLHAKLIGALDTALNRLLPDGYFADIDEHVWLQAEDPDDRLLLGRPDNYVTRPDGAGGRRPRNGGVAVAEPTTEAVLPIARRETQKYVKIVGPDRSTVVTVVEILSPSNKASDRAKYLAKREEYIASRTNLVELDLLRDGMRMPMGRPSSPGGDYYIFVARSAAYPAVQVWQFTVRDAIPNFPIPLRPEDEDVPVPFQSLFEETYETKRYSKRIDYSVPPVPPLRPTDAAWAADLLKKAAKRKKK